MAGETGYGTPQAPASTEEKGFVEKAWDAQRRLEKRIARFGSGRYARVLKMARKPEPDEYRRTATIVAFGLLLIGAVGFIILLLMDLLNAALGVK